MAPISQFALGTLLVLAMWSVLGLVVVLSGIPFAMWTQGQGQANIRVATIRRSMWWGYTLLMIFVLAASLSAPLGSSQSTISVGVPLAALAVVGLVLLIRSPCSPRQCVPIRLPRMWLSVGFLVLVAAFFALAALGPANNYDTGLYHLGAIKYAAEFGVVPGLANLYFPFGYASSHFALAGWFSSTPWGPEGYRLINGFVIMLALVDLLLRWLERKRTPGTWVLTIGLTAAAFPLISIADFWVTSPTSDSAVLVLTIVASAYLLDAVLNKNPSDWAVSTLIVTLMAAMRPTMVIFALLVVITGGYALLRIRRTSAPRGSIPRLALAVGLSAAAVAVLQLSRDRLLSGWLVYPLSALPLDVPWRAPDPTPFRDATLAAARNPAAQDQYQVAHTWDWIGPWFLDRWGMWETYMLLGLLALGGTAWWLLPPVARRLRWRALGVLWLPSGLASLAWFIASPPSYRFAWGPLTVFAIAPLAAALVARQCSVRTRLGVERSIPRLCGVMVLGLVLVSVAIRTDYASISQTRTWTLAGLTLNYAVAPQPEVATTGVMTEGGVEVKIPDVGDQCWDTYPLCTPLPTETLRYAGSGLESGFTS